MTYKEAIAKAKQKAKATGEAYFVYNSWDLRDFCPVKESFAVISEDGYFRQGPLEIKEEEVCWHTSEGAYHNPFVS